MESSEGMMSGTEQVDVNSMKRVFQELISRMDAKEKALLEKEESSVRREQQLDELEREMMMNFEKKLEEMEMRKEELGSILKKFSVWEEKLNKQEKSIAGLFEKFGSEAKKMQEMLGKRARDLDEKEEKLKILAKQIELREKLLELKDKKLEEEFKIKEELIELTKKKSNMSISAGNPEDARVIEQNLADRSEYAGVRNNTEARKPDESTIASRIYKRTRTSENRTKGVSGSSQSHIAHQGVPPPINRSQPAKQKDDQVQGTYGSSVLKSGVPMASHVGSRGNAGSAPAGTVSGSNKPIAPNGIAVKFEQVDVCESDAALCEKSFVVTESEFSDFDKLREESCFRVGQIWACYDQEGLPRCYTLIRKVYSNPFMVRINWLYVYTDDEGEFDWVMRDLPVGCGKFTRGKPQNDTDLCVFSHPIFYEKGQGNTLLVYPRKEETWALFKDWDIRWSNDVYKKCKYEIVEVVSDFMEGVGVEVASLEKLNGFVSLFWKTNQNRAGSVLVPAAEKFRFSHRVPSFKITGLEKEGILEGSFELDPACLQGLKLSRDLLCL